MTLLSDNPMETRQPPAWAGWVLGVSLVAIVAFVRLWMWADYLIPLAHVVPLVICVWWRSLRLLWTLAAMLLVMIVVKFAWVLPVLGADIYPLSLITFAGVAMLLELLIITAALQVVIVSRLRLEAQRTELQEKTTQLETLNRESAVREEEIARQNEELQSQTEELERQAEELRIVNDELARREKMLESLLDLSRSLTAGLSRDETLHRICQAMRQLVDGAQAAGVFERHGEQMQTLCHEGFGDSDPVPATIPFRNSFASLIFEHGRTGYLEDIRQRPDIRIPQSVNGEPFASVLAAPLMVRGRIIGTLEMYGREHRSWTEEQIALVESLAAQASISLETAQLFDEIQRERSKFEAVVRTLPICVLVAEDAECRTVRGNPAAAALYNAPLDANFSPIAPPEQRIERSILRAGRVIGNDEHPLLRAVLEKLSVRGEEFEIVFPGGRRVETLVSCAPIFNGQGHVAGGVCAFVDISRLKDLEREIDRRRREAEEASLRKSRFLAVVSHDIRTPANALSLLAEMISRTAGNPALADQVPHFAEELQNSARTLVALVSDVLDVARYDAGKVELIEAEFSLGSLMKEECRQLQPLAAEKELMFECEAPDPPIHVRADRVKLARILGNLISNAIKFTERGGVRVSACVLPDRRVRIDVADTGIGIPQEDLPRIFDEFHQLRHPKRQGQQGSGLGLAICNRLITAMGGQIEVQSEPGRGSTFSVVLPATCLLNPSDGPTAPPCDDDDSSGTPFVAPGLQDR